MTTKPERADDESIESASPPRPVAVFRHVMTQAPEAASSPGDGDKAGDPAPWTSPVEIAVPVEAPPVSPSATMIFRRRNTPESPAEAPARPTEDSRPAPSDAGDGRSRSVSLFPLAPDFEAASWALLALNMKAAEVLHTGLAVNLDYAGRSFRTATFSDILDLRSQWFRSQTETMMNQAKDIGELSRKVTGGGWPIAAQATIARVLGGGYR